MCYHFLFLFLFIFVSSEISERVESLSYDEKNNRLFFTTLDIKETGSLYVINNVYESKQLGASAALNTNSTSRLERLAFNLQFLRGVEFDACEK